MVSKNQPTCCVPSITVASCKFHHDQFEKDHQSKRAVRRKNKLGIMLKINEVVTVILQTLAEKHTPLQHVHVHYLKKQDGGHSITLIAIRLSLQYNRIELDDYEGVTFQANLCVPFCLWPRPPPNLRGSQDSITPARTRSTRIWKKKQTKMSVSFLYFFVVYLPVLVV